MFWTLEINLSINILPFDRGIIYKKIGLEYHGRWLQVQFQLDENVCGSSKRVGTLKDRKELLNGLLEVR